MLTCSVQAPTEYLPTGSAWWPLAVLSLDLFNIALERTVDTAILYKLVMICAAIPRMHIPIALTLDDLAAVYSSLFEARSKWFSIGLELGVDATKLTDIERDGSDDSKALRKMLMIVLKKQICGRRLCDALRERVVDEAFLAQNLEVNLPRSIISRRLQSTNFITRGMYYLYDPFCIPCHQNYSATSIIQTPLSKVPML